MKKKIKILKTIAVVLTVLSCLSSVPLGILFLGLAREVGGDYLGPLFSFGSNFLGVVLLISCAITVMVIWLLHYILKKRIEQGKPILPIIIVVAVVWLLPRVVSGVLGVISTLAQNNLNFII